MSQEIILASTSPYRKVLLEKLQINFTQISPEVDETRLPNESEIELSLRLGQEKAKAVAKRYPNALVIGSDQVGLVEGILLTKPGSIDVAKQQLKRQSGKLVEFYTSVAVVHKNKNIAFVELDTTKLLFKHLSDTEIDYYLEKERPFNCAGSFKSEGLGISLFEKIESDDPHALVGLPIIKLCKLLKKAGFDVLSNTR